MKSSHELKFLGKMCRQVLCQIQQGALSKSRRMKEIRSATSPRTCDDVAPPRDPKNVQEHHASSKISWIMSAKRVVDNGQTFLPRGLQSIGNDVNKSALRIQGAAESQVAQ